MIKFLMPIGILILLLIIFISIFCGVCWFAYTFLAPMAPAVIRISGIIIIIFIFAILGDIFTSL